MKSADEIIYNLLQNIAQWFFIIANNLKGLRMDMKIADRDLAELIGWARRYTDSRSTYSANQFNQIYETIVENNPEFPSYDQYDDKIYNKGEFWPFAQDGMYNSETGSFDATSFIKEKTKKTVLYLIKEF